MNRREREVSSIYSNRKHNQSFKEYQKYQTRSQTLKRGNKSMSSSKERCQSPRRNKKKDRKLIAQSSRDQAKFNKSRAKKWAKLSSRTQEFQRRYYQECRTTTHNKGKKMYICKIRTRRLLKEAGNSHSSQEHEYLKTFFQIIR